MHIKILPESPLIFLCQETGFGTSLSFVLRAVSLKNDHAQPCLVESLQLKVCSGEKMLKEIIYRGEALKGLVNKPFVNRSGLQGFNSQMLLGQTSFWNLECLQKTLDLEPDDELGLLLEHVHMLEKSKPDRLEVLVEYTESSQTYSSTYAAREEIQMQEWQSENRYILPLRGRWLMTNTALGLSHHRLGYSQEFAIDLIQLDGQQRFIEPKSQQNLDYPGYGSEVIAVADGVVVASVDGIPENPGPLSQMLSAAEKQTLLKTYRHIDVVGGNHIIIEHAHEEFSYYAHLIPASLMVSVGEQVRQGQVLGRLGNSGNSDAPHLHFQMMKGPDILSARGLPCVFENLKEVISEQPVRTELTNNLWVYTSE